MPQVNSYEEFLEVLERKYNATDLSEMVNYLNTQYCPTLTESICFYVKDTIIVGLIKSVKVQVSRHATMTNNDGVLFSIEPSIRYYDLTRYNHYTTSRIRQFSIAKTAGEFAKVMPFEMKKALVESTNDRIRQEREVIEEAKRNIEYLQSEYVSTLDSIDKQVEDILKSINDLN